MKESEVREKKVKRTFIFFYLFDYNEKFHKNLAKNYL